MNVLVVEDDPIFAALAETSLAASGYHVTVAKDGAEALEMLENGEFALALIDLSMPRIDGFRLLALLRSTSRFKGLPVIVVTSRNDAKAVQEAYALGANAFEVKPINWTLMPVQMLQVIKVARKIADLEARVAELARGSPAGLRLRSA
jgi:CheY-like chemotaxis protein